MLLTQRIQIALGLALLAAGGYWFSTAVAQPPARNNRNNPPAANRPGSAKTAPASARPVTNGPAVQLVSPTENADPAAGSSDVKFAPPMGDPADPFPVGPPRPAGDPTIPSPEVRQMLEAGNSNRTNNNQAPAIAAIPAMTIRARLISRNKPGVAVIDVGGTPLTIRTGDTFSIGGGQGAGALRLKVLDVNLSDIRLEVENRRQILTLN